ncbi:hypothetical protein [Gephyromycinifex aptenodytis]|uniref:hypothetical protein n=1 Tax=Gephyromycinifex aptenodytis TaxID=2716227 RepID=UPI0014488C69|nr:hypothetical protein [Gephyromycinifex aptenodytis]
MSVAARLTAFFIALLIIGGAAAALGAAVHPQLPGSNSSTPATSTHTMGGH